MSDKLTLELDGKYDTLHFRSTTKVNGFIKIIDLVLQWTSDTINVKHIRSISQNSYSVAALWDSWINVAARFSTVSLTSSSGTDVSGRDRFPFTNTMTTITGYKSSLSVGIIVMAFPWRDNITFNNRYLALVMRLISWHDKSRIYVLYTRLIANLDQYLMNAQNELSRNS